MTLRRRLRPDAAIAALALGILLAGCTSTPSPSTSPTATGTVTPRPSATATPTSTPKPSPTPEAAAPAAYDLEAAYAACVNLSLDDVAGMTGAFAPFDPADTNPISEEKITAKDEFADDPNALMMHVHWASDTDDLEATTFCSISGPFDASAIVEEQGSSNR